MRGPRGSRPRRRRCGCGRGWRWPLRRPMRPRQAFGARQAELRAWQPGVRPQQQLRGRPRLGRRLCTADHKGNSVMRHRAFFREQHLPADGEKFRLVAKPQQLCEQPRLVVPHGGRSCLPLFDAAHDGFGRPSEERRVAEQALLRQAAQRPDVDLCGAGAVRQRRHNSGNGAAADLGTPSSRTPHWGRQPLQAGWSACPTIASLCWRPHRPMQTSASAAGLAHRLRSQVLAGPRAEPLQCHDAAGVRWQAAGATGCRAAGGAAAPLPVP